METIRNILVNSFSPIVATRVNLKGLPEFALRKEVSIHEMDVKDEAHVNDWLGIFNDAFRRKWTQKDFQKSIVNNKIVKVISTYFLSKDGIRIGAASIGHYRKKPEIGVGHYLCVKSEAQGQGLGKYLAHYRYNELKKSGFEIAESETRIRHRESIFLHFQLGFNPKNKIDYWNSSDSVNILVKYSGNSRLEKMYRQWAEVCFGAFARKSGKSTYTYDQISIFSRHKLEPMHPIPT